MIFEKNSPRSPQKYIKKKILLIHKLSMSTGDSQGWGIQKVVFTKISAHVSMSNKSIFKIKLSMSSLNVVLPYYIYNTSNKKVSSQLKNFKNF
jgi:hypothetical protein